MSEAFDPGDVTRLYLNNAGPFGSDTGKVECVRAADYDKLLALYREAAKDRPSDLKRIQDSYCSGSQASTRTHPLSFESGAS